MSLMQKEVQIVPTFAIMPVEEARQGRLSGSAASLRPHLALRVPTWTMHARDGSIRASKGSRPGTENVEGPICFRRCCRMLKILQDRLVADGLVSVVRKLGVAGSLTKDGDKFTSEVAKFVELFHKGRSQEADLS